MASTLDRSFKELEKAFLTKEFYTLFFDKMNKDLTRYYGKDEALDMLKLLGNKRIKVENPEIFFDSTAVTEDSSLKIYRSNKSPKDFFDQYAMKYRMMSTTKCRDLKLPLFFFATAQFDNRDLVHFPKYVKEFLKLIASPLKDGCCITLQVVDFPIFERLKIKLGLEKLSGFQYYASVHRFVAELMKVLKDPFYKDFTFPKIEIIRSIYKDTECQAKYYLRDIFITTKRIVDKITENVKTFNEDNSELRAAISMLASLKPNYYYDEDSIVKEVIRISKSRPFNLNPLHTLTWGITNPYFNQKQYYDLAEHTLITLDTCDYIPNIIQSEISVDCKDLKEPDIDKILNYATSAARIGLIKVRTQKKETGITLVTLKDVNFFSEELIKKVKKLQENLSKQYNKLLMLNIKFAEGFDKSTINTKDTEYIRVISDIHADVNEGRGYVFNFGNDFVVNCGDTASTYIKATDWMLGNMKQGLVVQGNHLGYEYPHPELGVLHQKNSKTGQIKQLNLNFKNNMNISVLGLLSTIKYNGLNFIGGCLYSDLKLYGEDNFNLVKQTVSRSINDFRRCYVVTNSEGVKPFTIDDHIRFFDLGVKELRKQVNKSCFGTTVLVTHFAPLPYSVADEYKGDPVSAYFVSDLRWFLKKHSKIRLWCHGHTHAKFDYIYRYKNNSGEWKETRVVCNPFGYYNENNADLPDNYGTRIKIADIKSRKPWTEILAEEIKKGKVKLYVEGVNDEKWYK